MEELAGREVMDALDENEDERPTVPAFKVPITAPANGPDAITLPGNAAAPFFDVATAAFFSDGERALVVANDTAALTAEEEIAAWWAAQRRTSAARWVTALLALCVLLLAAGALRDVPDETASTESFPRSGEVEAHSRGARGAEPLERTESR